ncbi:MAG TPA: hypothetical protein VH540_19620 [Ktedonobacterales bacterium]|jgi:hypothetical protein
MQNRKLSEALAGLVGASEVERGTRLGILAGCVALILLFGAGALAQKTSNTVDFAQGQYAGLVIRLVAGFVVLVFALILAYYAGLSAPEAKTGEPTRAGMLAGALTMVLFWVGQTIFALVDSARAPEGLQLDEFLRSRFIAGLGFFVVGGLFGWWGCRSAARRARSIFTLSDSSLPLTHTSSGLTFSDTLRSTTASSRPLEPAPIASKPVEQQNDPAEERTLAGSQEEPAGTAIQEEMRQEGMSQEEFGN